MDPKQHLSKDQMILNKKANFNKSIDNKLLIGVSRNLKITNKSFENINKNEIVSMFDSGVN